MKRSKFAKLSRATIVNIHFNPNAIATMEEISIWIESTIYVTQSVLPEHEQFCGLLLSSSRLPQTTSCRKPIFLVFNTFLEYFLVSLPLHILHIQKKFYTTLNVLWKWNIRVCNVRLKFKYWIYEDRINQIIGSNYIRDTLANV